MVKHIVTSGCSFSDFSGTWATLLNKKVNANVYDPHEHFLDNFLIPKLDINNICY